jgi:hypothetical protein
MSSASSVETHISHSRLIVALAWASVGLPLLWGVMQTLYKAAQLFR